MNLVKVLSKVLDEFGITDKVSNEHEISITHSLDVIGIGLDG